MPTKSDQIRKLLAEGKTRAEIARILGVTYQQVYQVDKKRHDSPMSTGPRPTSGLPAYGSRGSGMRPLGGENLPSFSYPSKPAEFGKRTHVRTGPTQLRVATQGHDVVVEPIENVCTECKGRVLFSLKHLAYIHAGSLSPVTKVVDLQEGPGLLDPL